MSQRVVKCEKRTLRDSSPTFYHLCRHLKKPDGTFRSFPFILLREFTRLRVQRTKWGYRDADPRRHFAVGVVGTVTQIAVPTILIPSLLHDFRTGSENIKLRHVTRYMCTNSRARKARSLVRDTL